LTVDATRGPVLIYDAQCPFCRRWVARLKRWDRNDRIRLLPLQDPAAPAVAGRRREVLQQAAHLVREDGEVFSGARAAREALAYLPTGWLLRALARLPGVMALADRGYRWVARTWGPSHG
jgi:predicted DCC family thiol-disulfide oxidoreductase YuxK